MSVTQIVVITNIVSKQQQALQKRYPGCAIVLSDGKNKNQQVPLMLSWMPSAVPGGFAVAREMEKQRFIMSVQTYMGVHTPCEHILKFQSYPRFLVQCNHSGLVFYCINVTVTKDTTQFKTPNRRANSDNYIQGFLSC